MAEDFDKKVSLIEIEVDNGAAMARVDELTESITRQKSEAKKNADEIRDLNKENKSLADQVKKGTITQAEASKAIEANNKKIIENEKANFALKEEIKSSNKERASAVKATQLQSNSLDALRKKTAEQKKELNGLNTGTEKGRKRFDELTKSLNANNAKIIELDQGAGDYKTTIGNYRGEVGKAITDTGLFGGVIGRLTAAKQAATSGLVAYKTAITGTTTATNGASKAAKAFKIALASTGIGLIVVALGSLITFLTTTQAGMDKLSQVTKPVQVIFQKLLGVVQVLGEKVFAQLGEAIENPIETIKSLGQAILDNVINRFKSVMVLGDAFAALMKGDFKEASKLGADAFIQLGTGVEDGTDKIKDATNALGDFVGESVKIGQTLADLDKEIEIIEISLIKNRAKLTAEYEKQKEVAADLTKSEAERLAAAKAAQNAQNDLLVAEQNFIDKKIERAELENTLNDTDRSAQKELAELVAQRTNFEAQASKKRTSARSLENTIKKQISAEEEARQKKAQEAELKRIEEQEAEKKEQLEKEKKLAEERANNEMILNQKLLALNEFRRSQQNENRLEEIEDLQTYYETKKEIEEENFEIEQERLAEQNEIAQENEDLTAEEKAIKQAEYDLKIEQLKAEHADRMVEISENQKESELRVEEEKHQKRLAIFRAGQQAIQGGFEVANNVIENFYNKRYANIEKQLKEGTITEEQFAKKKERIEKNKAKDLHRSQVAEFRVKKAINIASITADIAKSIAQAIGATPLTAGLPFTAINAALGAVQLATVISQKAPPPPTFAKGGDVFATIAGGNLHSNGGTKFYGEDGNRFEVERDEGIFVTKRSATNPALRLLDEANRANGGSSMFSNSSRFLQDGGEVAMEGSEKRTAQMIMRALEGMPSPTVDVVSIMAGINADMDAKKTGVV